MNDTQLVADTDIEEISAFLDVLRALDAMHLPSVVPPGLPERVWDAYCKSLQDAWYWLSDNELLLLCFLLNQ